MIQPFAILMCDVHNSDLGILHGQLGKLEGVSISEEPMPRTYRYYGIDHDGETINWDELTSFTKDGKSEVRVISLKEAVNEITALGSETPNLAERVSKLEEELKELRAFIKEELML